MNMRWPGTIVVSMFLLFAGFANASQADKPLPCSSSEYRQFDFWVGDWDAFDVSNPTVPVARTTVSRILDGCVLLEDYRAADGHEGQSFSIYDASRKFWMQSWVTSRGQALVIEGEFRDGQMTLSGRDQSEKGPRVVRGVWKAVDGGVSEAAVESMDGGKTWQPWFDLIFRPHKIASDLTEDQKALAALDTGYQAAVKRNDAATMDRILADDFILVTGSGKVYSKDDLLKESRSGLVIYEHQEDTSQTVRVWGDTAVVTAKLWEKGTNAGKPFDYTVWFSDTYIRTPAGWRYIFGQSSFPPPKTS